jgi:hypothetical protein
LVDSQLYYCNLNHEEEDMKKLINALLINVHFGANKLKYKKQSLFITKVQYKLNHIFGSQVF